MVLFVVAPRHRASRRRAAAIRTAVYAWLEEISFRTGVTALIVVAAIIIGGAIAAVDLAAYGGGRSAVRHAAGRAGPAGRPADGVDGTGIRAGNGTPAAAA